MPLRTMIIVSLALATICFSYQGKQECHNALVGSDTPIGQFTAIRRFTEQPGYGGDVLQFSEEQDIVYAIHRVWTLRPLEKRLERIRSNNPKTRVITKGCVNVLPEVYERLIDCCSSDKVEIRP